MAGLGSARPGAVAGQGLTAERDGGEFFVGLTGIKILGYEGLRYCFRSFATGGLVVWTPRQLCAANLCVLHSLHWWRSQYPVAHSRLGRPFDVDAARNELMEACHRVGLYNSEAVWFGGRPGR
jgi:hypothetical protein